MVSDIVIAAAAAVVLAAIVLGVRRFAKAKSPELAVVEAFYRNYLTSWKSTEMPPRTPRDLPYSHAFMDLIDLHDRTCAEKHQQIGGWGVDEDVFLDSSQVDPELTLGSSRFAVSEPRKGLVEVMLNVYPSMTDAGDAYDRTVQFLMIEEAGT